MKYFLRALFSPSCWIRSHGTSLAWDKRLNQLLDNPETVVIQQHTTYINGVCIWTSNFPYGYGSRYRPAESGLPKRSTAYRLNDFLEGYL